MNAITDEILATPTRIEHAAVEAFFERGYRATTMREIADGCDLTVGALYNHFTSKDQLLASILMRVHDELERQVSEAVEAAGDDVRARFAALVRAQALFHTNHTTEARVANRELVWLPEPERGHVVGLRRAMRRWFEDAIADGVRLGIFEVPDVKATVKAILNSGIGIADWFRHGGALSAEQVADVHAELALRMVEARR
jgi:AcrR family transcriptional regulator